MLNKIHFGDCRNSMTKFRDAGVVVQTCVTSPPYWQLRDHGVDGQIGLEDTMDTYLDAMVAVFRGVRDILAPDGTIWVNLGDGYSQGGNGGHCASDSFHGHNKRSGDRKRIPKKVPPGFKPKDLLGIPWRVAFALQDDGWYLRQDIIWNKPNPMPESVRDRCTKSHEYIFLLSKSRRYYFDQDAIKEPVTGTANSRGHGVNPKSTGVGFGYADHKPKERTRRPAGLAGETPDIKNKRSVWTVPTEAFHEAHFATYPRALIAPCILAGSRPGDVVLDPFMGSGTTAQVAQELGREWIGCELNPEYAQMQKNRVKQMGLKL